jgi:L-threonylcarbamoyladenylate synthase
MARPLPDILRIDWPRDGGPPTAATLAALDRAADLLRRGGLVAIPTETVYGLAANAFDPEAVAGIFRAKGRPAGNPLIVHVSDAEQARALSSAWPPAAAALAAAVWPGPATVVVPRSPQIPGIVTAEGPTVALRCPAHPVSRLLIERAGIPLAAPSANRSEAVSPTTAQHVLTSLGHRVDLILDAGSCERGIESTVVDCTTTPPRILRPGPLSRAELEAALGGAVDWPEPGDPTGLLMIERSPGQGRRHYAPQTVLEVPADPPARVEALLASGQRVGWLVLAADERTRGLAGSRDLVVVPMPPEPIAYARQFYATLHALDQRELDRIVADPPPATEPWAAVRDRLSRGAS